MSSLARFHADFIRALVEGEGGALADHLDAPARLPRAVVYRNNVYASAVGALASSFPAVAAVAGRERFRAMAARYLELRPPRTRSLVGYGRDLALALRNSPELDAPLLSDLARLDRAWLEAHLSLEDRALCPADIEDLAPEALLQLKPALRASVRFVLASGAAFDRWSALRFSRTEGLGAAASDDGSATTLIWRPGGEVVRRRLSDGEAQLLIGLAAGDRLGVAAQTALAADPRFDLVQAFAAALAAGVFAAGPPPSITEVRR
jgi:hypothetical protein